MKMIALAFSSPPLMPFSSSQVSTLIMRPLYAVTPLLILIPQGSKTKPNSEAWQAC